MKRNDLSIDLNETGTFWNPCLELQISQITIFQSHAIYKPCGSKDGQIVPCRILSGILGIIRPSLGLSELVAQCLKAHHLPLFDVSGRQHLIGSQSGEIACRGHAYL